MRRQTPTPANETTDNGRVSPTAPESKSLSATVWAWLDSIPGLTEELHQAEEDILAGKGTPYRELTRGR